MNDIYLDDAATSKPLQVVIDAMMPYMTMKWHNPSALYNKAKEVWQDVLKARNTVAEFINADKYEIFFTSGGSESNCWAIQGFINECLLNNECPLIITSAIEHKSIKECVLNANANSFFVAVDNEGFIDINHLEQLLRYASCQNYRVLVSIQFANNEIGTIQHIGAIADIVHKYNAVFHTDAVQAFGKVSINVNKLGIDMMSVSGHKIGTPKGVGFLYKKHGIDIQPLIYGSQMDGMRGGTENVPYIIGFARAIRSLKNDNEYDLRMTILRNNFIAKLKVLGCKINGSLDNRLCNNISITFNKNVSAESMVFGLDTSGIYIATGSACNSASIEHSYVLKAIGLTDEEASKTIRITLPHNITMEEIDYVVSEIEKQIRILTTPFEITVEEQDVNKNG